MDFQLLQLWGDVLPVTVDRDMVRQLLPSPKDEVLPSRLCVEHLVPYARVELVWVCLSGFMKLESNLSVNAQAEVIVDDLQGKLVNSFLSVRLESSIQCELQTPAVKVYHFG